jgi:hypothetical protein
MGEINGKGDTNKVIQNINEVLQRILHTHHAFIQAETRNLCEMGAV